MFYSWYSSTVGDLLLIGEPDALHHISFRYAEKSQEIHPDWEEDNTVFTDVIKQLDEYFAFKRKTFDLPLSTNGTKFQSQVWDFMCNIPFGETLTYTDVACGIDRPKALRAVGNANVANPIPIVIPSHRVVGLQGDLTGFAGGLPIKQWLINHETGRQLELFVQ